MQLKVNIEKFMKQLDLAVWYRGMSPFQDNAILSLYSKLRDDFEQGTCYRVDLCLRNIGINPVVSKKKLSQVIQLSRGHDLAFLFFLLEAYYKVDCKPKTTYTTNEQLLMTAICNLDIIMTIRELDRILPLGHPSKQTQLKRQQKEEQRRLQQESELRVKRPTKLKLPYFQKQPRPVEAAKPKKLCKPDLIVSFPFWKRGKKPVFTVRNEDRWFAEYKLNPVLRIVKECVDTAVGTFFDSLEKGLDPHQKKVTSLEKLKNAAKEAPQIHFQVEDNEMRESEKEPKSMCAYHKFMEEQAQLKKDTLVVAARNRCLEVINVSLNERKIQRERIAEQLNIDLDTYINKYKNLKYTRVQILHSDCSICQRQVATAKPNANRVKMISCKDDISHPCTERRYKVQRLSGGGIGSCVKDGRGIVNNVKKCVTRRGGLRRLDERSASDSVDEECVVLYENLKKKMTQRRKYPKPGCPPKVTASPRLHFSMQPNKNQQQLIVTYPNKVKITKRRFFNAPTAHTPHSFHYKHIFNIRNPDNGKLRIEQSLLKALKEPESEPDPDEMFFECEDGDFEPVDVLTFASKPCKYTSSSESLMCQSSELKLEKLDQKANIIDAVHKCIQTLMEHRRRLYEHQLAQEEKISSETETEFERIPKLKYDMDYFDPDDAELMDRMLKDGISKLRKDPRFVLASLPDAHKLRILREWIMRRYGKIYTENACNQELEQALKILKAVMHLLSGEPPDPESTGMPIGTIPYSDHEKALALAQQIKDKYFNSLNDKLMKQMNVCWFAFSTYTAAYVRAKNTFFSYMPAHHRDVKREHPWQSGDFRDYRQMRSMRLLHEAI